MSLRKPARNPDTVFNDDGCPTDQFRVMEWNPNPESPGMIWVDETVTTRQSFSSSGSTMRDTIACVNELADMGMREVYEATGIQTWLPKSGPANPLHRFAATYPTAEQFCRAANTLAQPESYKHYAPEGKDAVQFDPFKGTAYSSLDNVRAASKGRLLIATEGLTYHDMLDHAVAALALSREVVCSIRIKAANILHEIEGQHQNIRNHPKIEDMNDQLDQIINTRSLLGFLRGDEAKIETWRELFHFPNELSIQHVQAGIRRHIEAMRNTYDPEQI